MGCAKRFLGVGGVSGGERVAVILFGTVVSSATVYANGSPGLGAAVSSAVLL